MALGTLVGACVLALGSSVSGGMIHYLPGNYREINVPWNGTGTSSLGYWHEDWSLPHGDDYNGPFVISQETVLGSEGFGGGANAYAGSHPEHRSGAGNHMSVPFSIDVPFPYLLSQRNARVTLTQEGVGVVDEAFGEAHEVSGVIGPGTYLLAASAEVYWDPRPVFASVWATWFVAIPAPGSAALASAAGLVLASRRRR